MIVGVLPREEARPEEAGNGLKGVCMRPSRAGPLVAGAAGLGLGLGLGRGLGLELTIPGEVGSGIGWKPVAWTRLRHSAQDPSVQQLGTSR